MVNLRVNPDFEVVLEWLRDNRKTTRDELEKHAEDLKFGRAQGRAQTLGAIIDTHESAPTQLAKHK